MNRFLDLLRRHSWAFALVLTIGLLIVNLLVSPHFLSPERLPGTLATLAPFVLVGFASTPSILAGGIDISVGPLATFINCLFVAILIPAGLGNWDLAAPIILAVAAGIGALNGSLVAVLRLHPVVATTGMLFLLVGLSLTIAQNPVAAPDNWTELFAGGIGIVPGALITIGVAGLIWFALRRT